MDDKKPNLGGAVAIVLGPSPENKTVLVYDVNRINPEWKFAGGGTEPIDTFVIDPTTGWNIPIADEKVVAVRTALRELEEETGLKPAKDAEGKVQAMWAGCIYQNKRKGYTHYILVVVDDLTPLKKVGNEGELVRTCTFEEISSGKVSLLQYHKTWLDDYRKIHNF